MPFLQRERQQVQDWLRDTRQELLDMGSFSSLTSAVAKEIKSKADVVEAITNADHSRQTAANLLVELEDVRVDTEQAMKVTFRSFSTTLAALSSFHTYVPHVARVLSCTRVNLGDCVPVVYAHNKTRVPRPTCSGPRRGDCAAKGPAAGDQGTGQLRHHFGPFLKDFSAMYHPIHAVCYVLLSARAYWMLIGACNPML